MTDAPIALEVTRLVKRYGDFEAVKGISFSVARGAIVGFLGPNGAGKTTTIQVLTGVTLSNGGSIRYFGHDFVTEREQCLSHINTTSAFNTLMGRITVWENLFMFAELYCVGSPKEKIASLLAQFEIERLADVLYKDLSAGQKTRVNLAKAHLNDPELLLMDEPTASLDPDIADKTLTLIESLRAERGLSILYTSHNMLEIERICDEVIFLDKGTIVAHDTPKNLTQRVSGARLAVTFSEKTAELDRYLAERRLPHSFETAHTVSIESHERDIPGLLFDLSKTGIWITDISITKPTLEDVFLEIARKEDTPAV
jgi:ABC-2 type transport system ATP-binding protein